MCAVFFVGGVCMQSCAFPHFVDERCGVDTTAGVLLRLQIRCGQSEKSRVRPFEVLHRARHTHPHVVASVRLEVGGAHVRLLQQRHQRRAVLAPTQAVREDVP